MDMKEMKLLSEWSYEPKKIERGYSRETLYVGLGNNDGNYKFEKRPVSDDMVEKFTGGRGFGLKLLWDAVTEKTKWDDPENEIVIAGGPFCGITQYPGAGKCYSVFLSPATKQTYNSNAGGYFAPFLKFSGFDALEIQGKADRPVVVFIDGDNYKVQVFESTLEDINAYYVSEELHEYFAKDENDKKESNALELKKHLENNKEKILRYDERDLSIPQPPEGVVYKGMGVQENQNATVIAMRMKHGRKRWKEHSANNMAKLLYHNENGNLLEKVKRYTDGALSEEMLKENIEILSAAKAPKKDGKGSPYVDVFGVHMPIFDSSNITSAKLNKGHEAGAANDFRRSRCKCNSGARQGAAADSCGVRTSSAGERQESC